MFKNLFKKDKGDVVDLADLQKRGILKKRQIREKSANSGIVDFTSKAEEGSALGFLGSLAGASETKDISSDFGTTFDSERKQRLKGVLRDIRMDMKNTSDKVYKISERLDLIEKKLERLERKSNYGQ